jgi:hypothetical protein
MINFLPPEEKRELEQRKLFFKVLDLEFLLLSFFVFLAILFFGGQKLGYFFVQENRTLYEAKEKEALLYKDLENEIEEFNLLTLKVGSLLREQKKIVPILEKIISILPNNISLNSISISLEKEKFKVGFSGIAASREDLVLLKLKLEENFGEVSFNPEAWIQPTKINFLVNFETK